MKTLIRIFLSTLCVFISSAGLVLSDEGRYSDSIIGQFKDKVDGELIVKTSSDGMRFGWVSRSSSDKNLNAHIKTLAGQVTNYTLDPPHLRVEDLLIGRGDDPDIAIITADSAGKFFLSIGTSDGKLESKELDIPIGSKIGLRCFWGNDGEVCLAYQGPNGVVCLESHPSRQTIIPYIIMYDGLSIQGNTRQVLFFPHTGPGESGRIYDYNWDGGITQVLAGTAGYARQPLHPLVLPNHHSNPVFVSSCDFISTEKSIALVHQNGIEHRAIFYWSDGHLCDIARLRNSIQGTKIFLGNRYILLVGNFGETRSDSRGRIIVMEITTDEELKFVHEVDLPYRIESMGGIADELRVGATDPDGTMHSIVLNIPKP